MNDSVKPDDASECPFESATELEYEIDSVLANAHRQIAALEKTAERMSSIVAEKRSDTIRRMTRRREPTSVMIYVIVAILAIADVALSATTIRLSDTVTKLQAEHARDVQKIEERAHIDLSIPMP